MDLSEGLGDSQTIAIAVTLALALIPILMSIGGLILPLSQTQYVTVLEEYTRERGPFRVILT